MKIRVLVVDDSTFFRKQLTKIIEADPDLEVAGTAINGKDARDYILDTSFLGEGTWKVEAFRDAADAAVEATHYVHETGNSVKAGTKLFYRMAPGGGFIVRFSK